MPCYDYNDNNDYEYDTMALDVIVEHLASMMKQESSYQCNNYLCSDSNNDVVMRDVNDDNDDDDMMIDVACRTAMSSWMFTVVDTLQLPREAATIAMSYVDRYVSTSAGKVSRYDRTQYQLTCMACFYTAVKVHSPVAIDPSLVSQLSRGAFTPAEIEEREVSVLIALKWKVNPPTVVCFLRYFHKILLSTFSGTDQDHTDFFQAMIDLATYQAEVSTIDYHLSVAGNMKPSLIAFAALMNAMESISDDDNNDNMMDDNIRQKLIGRVAMVANLNVKMEDVLTARTCLYEAVMGDAAGQLKPLTNTVTKVTKKTSAVPKKQHSCSVSPRSVTTAHHHHHQHRTTATGRA